MLRFFCLLYFFAGSALATVENEFTVVAYNVENLFDLDETALFDDYRIASGKPFAYNRYKLLTKLQNTARVLSEFSDGKGPDIILFQELEGDFSPESSMGFPSEFLQRYAHTTAAAMLTVEWKSTYAGLPAQAWLLKALYDAGMVGYEVACPPAETSQEGIAHVNALFSRFPITSVDYHSLVKARAIIEATIEIHGCPLYVYVNHWKSGASNLQREPIRVENARVLRSLIDRRLEVDPQADILIGGDLNSHYNHRALFPQLDATGINHILGSQGNEDSVRRSDGPALYNLWHELPQEQRASEVWRGKQGTLMHLIISRGLYDDFGISYSDNSFGTLAQPGLNADLLGRPFSWSFAGRAGGGFSDHFPVEARFCLAPVAYAKPTSLGRMPEVEFPLRYTPAAGIDLPDGTFLADVADDDLGQYLSTFYKVHGRITSLKPLQIEVDNFKWPAYAPDPEISESLGKGQTGDWAVTLGVWRGQRQLIIEGIL